MNVSGTSDVYGAYFRVYAYCSEMVKGDISVLMINISPIETISAIIDVGDGMLWWG